MWLLGQYRVLCAWQRISPALVQQDLHYQLRVLAPSSALLNWETIAGLLGLSISQNKWKPPHEGMPPGAATLHVDAYCGTF